jgi:hypothetical protein
MIIVDRFEGENAVLETEDGTAVVSKSLFCENVKEGDVVVLKNERYFTDTETTAERRERIAARMRKIHGKV